MAAPHTSLLDGPLFEPTLLRAATRRANAFSDPARERMKPWLSAAQARYRVALELRDGESRGVALGLLREAAFFALRALEAADSEPAMPSATPSAAWQRFQISDGAPAEWLRVRDAFSVDDALALEVLAVTDDGELRLAAEATVAWLLGLAEVRSPQELARVRWLRVGLMSGALLVLLWALFAYWSALGALSPHVS
ncbi:MAG: hypothetical protein ABW061_00225 [Polyangiaceae bacterium]